MVLFEWLCCPLVVSSLLQHQARVLIPQPALAVVKGEDRAFIKGGRRLPRFLLEPLKYGGNALALVHGNGILPFDLSNELQSFALLFSLLLNAYLRFIELLRFERLCGYLPLEVLEKVILIDELFDGYLLGVLVEPSYSRR